MKYDNSFFKIEDLVNSSFHNPDFTIISICEHFSISRTTLHRIFKRKVGLSASHYLNSIRLAKAYNILTYENTTIKETSERVGYTDPKYFSKMFKKKYGVLPTKL